MYRPIRGSTPITCLAIACVLLAIAAAGISAQETKAATTPEDDFRRTIDAYNAEKDKEAQFKLWFAFLERNPDSNYTIGTISFLANGYYADHLKDPKAGLEFIKRSAAAITDTKRKNAALREQIGLLGALRDREGLRSLRAEIEKAGALSLQDYGLFADGFSKAEDWATVRDLCDEAEGKLTAEFVRAQNPDRQMSDEQVARTLDNARSQLFRYYGKAYAGLGDLKTAIGKYAEAAKHTTANYAGVAYDGVTLEWAEALLATGDHAGALALLAPYALIYEEKEALALYEKAWLAAGNDAAGFAAHLGKARLAIAKPAPDFTAFGYDGNPVTFAEVRGEVTFLGFWFPT